VNGSASISSPAMTEGVATAEKTTEARRPRIDIVGARSTKLARSPVVASGTTPIFAAPCPTGKVWPAGDSSIRSLVGAPSLGSLTLTSHAAGPGGHDHSGPAWAHEPRSRISASLTLLTLTAYPRLVRRRHAGERGYSRTAAHRPSGPEWFVSTALQRAFLLVYRPHTSHRPAPNDDCARPGHALFLSDGAPKIVSPIQHR